MCIITMEKMLLWKEDMYYIQYIQMINLLALSSPDNVMHLLVIKINEF